MTDSDLDDERTASTGHIHPAMRELFPAYATAIALGGIPQNTDPDLLAHLATCAACRAELEELSALAGEAYSGQVPAAPRYPLPDLSFLPARRPHATARSQPWLIDEVGRLVVEFSAALIEALSPMRLAGAPRGQFLYRYTQEPGSVRDLAVTIEVFAEDAARGVGRVRIGVDVPSRGPLDQSGSRVVLRAGEVAWQGETDETGCVDFAPVPLDAMPRLRVEIAPLRTEDRGSRMEDRG